MKNGFVRAAAFTAGFFAAAVLFSLTPLPDSLTGTGNDRILFFDKNGNPLNTVVTDGLNVFDTLESHEIPDVVKRLFVAAEDKDFYTHRGVDVRAVAAAVWQNASAGRIVRGASTVSEQAVRLMAPRPRTLFSKIMEGIDALRLERRFSKDDILTFYLNQVPYAANRRGIKQAARYYFGKTPDRLSLRETTALAVLVRAPSAFDLYRNPERLEKRVSAQLAAFAEKGLISPAERAAADADRLRVKEPEETTDAAAFLRFAGKNKKGGTVRTTLDSALQRHVQRLARQRLEDLRDRLVSNAAVIVLERKTGNVLAWVSESTDETTVKIDALLTPRQPASVQKPLLYALALEKGMTDTTEVVDEPLIRAVGTGTHRFKNYSRRHYGRLTLRQALANSLNIPAVKVIEAVSVPAYYDFLRRTGVSTLTKSPDFYREGLALGNAEIPPYEIARAWLMLANGGVLKNIRANKDDPFEERRLLSEKTAATIGDILADPLARQLEFDTDGVLNFPVRTAVKTGTSTGYRDAWAFGYSYDFLVGVWIGNLTYRPMRDVTGASGAAPLLRSVFSRLARAKATGVLPFVASSAPSGKTKTENDAPVILQPQNGTTLAVDPRLPNDVQAYKFELSALPDGAEAIWFVDGKRVGTGQNFFWSPVRGEHSVSAEVVLDKKEKTSLLLRRIYVK